MKQLNDFLLEIPEIKRSNDYSRSHKLPYIENISMASYSTILKYSPLNIVILSE